MTSSGSSGPDDDAAPKRSGTAGADGAGPGDGAGPEDLEARIEAARSAQRPPPPSGAAQKYNALTLAWRMALELVSGAGIGFLVGWGADKLLGTSPAFLVIFGLLGVVAGFKVMIETAQKVSRGDAQPEGRRDEGRD